MTEIGKGRWLNDGYGGSEGEEKAEGKVSVKTVMVYLMDKDRVGKEPLGIITERRKSERDIDNAIGMLRLARKEFAKTEEEALRIVIGNYI
jgi:hypothetical protein